VRATRWPTIPTTPLLVIVLCLVWYRLPFVEFEPWGFGPVDGSLPVATRGHAVELAPRLRIDGWRVVLDGRLVGDLEARAREPDHALDRLGDDLDAHRRNWSILHPREPFPGTLQLAIPAATPWGSIRPICLVAAAHGYGNLAFLVRIPPPDPPFDWDHFAAP
jgi:hypothetical protein